MKTPAYTTRFKRDFGLMLNRGKAETKFAAVAAKLLAGEPLEPRHRDHPLKGNLIG